MYVGLKMLKNFYTAEPKTLVKDAQKRMDEQDLGLVLVMEEGRVIGYVRKEDILASLPSMMTSLDKHEIGYLMSKLTVDKLLRKDILSVSPETEIEAAAYTMWKKNVAGLAVMDHGGKLLGYINRTVMLEVLVEELGYQQGGSRIVIETPERSGVLREVSGLIADMGLSIISTGTFYHKDRRLVVVRVATDDPSKVAAALQERNYQVVGPMDFMDEWT